MKRKIDETVDKINEEVIDVEAKEVNDEVQAEVKEETKDKEAEKKEESKERKFRLPLKEDVIAGVKTVGLMLLSAAVGAGVLAVIGSKMETTPLLETNEPETKTE